jgi:cell division septation protein DedD
MLVLFLTFVLVCAIFFAIGFSLGRKTTSMAGATAPVNSAAGTSAPVVRSSAAKQNASQTNAPSTDFSFYKSVGAKSTDTELAPREAVVQTTSTAEAKSPTPPSATAAPVAGAYFVQVAAVSRQEDAQALVEALKKKQYPAFAANNSSADRFFHVQVGPYSDLKEAESMRARLIADGYNPIVKK